MEVFVAVYKGSYTEEILGVFTDIEKAKEAIYKDYKETEFGYEPNKEVVDSSFIYIEKTGYWFDEWYIVRTKLYN